VTGAATAVVIRIWLAAHPHIALTESQQEAANAIAVAVWEQATPFTHESHALDLAVMAHYADLEANLDPDAVAIDPLAPGGWSCGLWQMRCAFVRHASVLSQAREWIRMVRAAGLGGVDSSPARARRRTARARELLLLALPRPAPLDGR
jgi:hypothetical protein